MAIDPWAGANQGLDSYNNAMLTLAQMKREDKEQAQRSSLLDLQKQLTQQNVDQNKVTLAELGAKKNALIDQYGTKDHTDPYASAVSFQNQQEQDRAALERKQKGFEVYLNTVKAIGEIKSLDPKSKTEIGKHLLAQNPEYAPFAKNLNYVDGEGVKAARMYKEGELIDPVTKKPLPAGYYETEGRWTGDAANPVELVAYKWVEPKPDQEALIDKRFENQLKLQSQQIAAQDRRTAAQIAAADRRADMRQHQQNDLNKLDMESAKALVKTLPKLKEEAIAANNSMERIDSMTSLIKSGVGGKKGQILSLMAPYAEMVGVNTKAMDEAQTYELMAKTIGGSMRMQIVGPGPVSNYENQLLQQISGGGRAGTAAAVELLGFYKKTAKGKVEDYNFSVDSVSQYSPATGKIYKRLGSLETERPARKLSAGASFINDQISAYNKSGLNEDAAQARILQKMKQRGWTKAQIGAAWDEYKGR